MSLSDNKIILLAGMHRSGTSALARVWNLLGAALPEPLVPAGVGNELGHWEPADVVALNDRALLSAGSDVNAVAPIAPEWFASTQAEAFRAEIEAYVRGLLAAAPLTLIKDPRISPLASLWRDAVKRAGGEPRFIIASRDPWEIAASLTSRQRKHFPDEVWPVERATAIWLRYLLSVEAASRGAPRTFADYAWLMDDWRGEIGRMARQLGVPSPQIDEARAQAVDAFLQPDAHRERREQVGGRDPLLDDADALIKARRSDPKGGGQAFDALGARFAGAFDVLGVYLAGLEDRVADLAKGPDGTAESRALRLRGEVERAEWRILDLNRRQENAPAVDDAEIRIAEAAKVRHAALVSAHRTLTEQVKRDREAWEMERATAKAAAAESRAQHRTLTQLRRAIAGVLELDAEDPKVTNARLTAGVRACVRESARLEAGLTQAKAQTAAEQTELAETRLAYEAIREELVALRRRLADAEEEVAGLADELTAEIEAGADRALSLQHTFAARHQGLAEEEHAQAARRMELEASGEQHAEARRHAESELFALTGSRAWRAVSALSRAASPLRPLLRRP